VRATGTPRRPLAALRDNVEAIAFALVMALLLRHFCVEVFKIPTASMYPTLRGDEPGKGTVGDRIIVDKWAYLAGGPERWDVPVFRFPLDRSRNFIKRVAFLPGEQGRMERGDLWVRRAGTDAPFLVARKPRDVRETLYVPVYPPRDAPRPDPNAFGRERASEIEPRVDAALAAAAEERAPALRAVEDEFGAQALRAVRDRLERLPPTHPAHADLAALDARLGERAVLRDYWRAAEGVAKGWRLERFGRFAFAGGAREGVDYAFGITDSTHAADASRSTHGAPVVDVRVRFRVEASAPAAIEVGWRPGDGRWATLRLASDAAKPSRLVTATRDSPVNARLEPGRSVAVELEYVDGDAHAWVDGAEVAVLPDDLGIEDAVAALEREGGEPQRLRITAEGGALVVTDVSVDRDLYYWSGRNADQNRPGPGESIVVPPDSYFMLGDNTRSSHDSRQWTAVGVALAEGRPDGLREVWWDSQNGPRGEHDREGGRGTLRTVTDVDGVVRSWYASEERDTLRKPLSFVTRDMIVGRAFFALVFWPPHQVPARFRLIH
jgi:signal peptidase I